jgi:hypothetical protein
LAISEQQGMAVLFQRGERGVPSIQGEVPALPGDLPQGTPPKALVKMFREWNLAEEVACRIKGAEDMLAAWKMLDAIYGSPLALTMDQTP